MKINSKNFSAFSMHDIEKELLIDAFAKELVDYYDIRAEKMTRYLQDTDKNYLITKSAIDIINNIKFSNTPELREMLIANADQSGTMLIDKDSFMRYYIDDDNYLACCYFKCEYGEPDARSQDEMVQMVARHSNFDLKNLERFWTYEAFKIKPDSISHPKLMLDMEVPEIEFFLKALIFIKCTNTELEILSPKAKKRTKIGSEKYLLDTDKDVTIVNAKYNKLVIRNEAFWVNPHGRFQRHGPQYSLVKYIIIDGYYKSGYKREYK